MANRKMSKKALNLAEHKMRLAGAGAPSGASGAWVVAGLLLGGAMLLMYLLK